MWASKVHFLRPHSTKHSGQRFLSQGNIRLSWRGLNLDLISNFRITNQLKPDTLTTILCCSNVNTCSWTVDLMLMKYLIYFLILCLINKSTIRTRKIISNSHNLFINELEHQITALMTFINIIFL